MPELTSPFEIHLVVDAVDTSAVDLLAETTGLSKQHIKQVMQKGAVWLEEKKTGKPRRLRRASKTLAVGDELHLYYDTHVLESIPAVPELVADQGEYSVWYKPYGLLSQGSKWGDHCTVQRWVEQNLTPQRPAFVVHRLDRAATGLIIIAHQKRIASDLAKLFAQRAMEKHYQVIVHGQFPEGTWPQKIDTDIDGRYARSYARLLEYNEEKNYSLLDVRIDTGRKHQIRKHLLSIGFPVVGDRLYGVESQREEGREDLQLTASSLTFVCPLTQQEKHFQLPGVLVLKL
ncbi:MAG: RluA family pseudouridine synthase [Gammaproteobacteria bacterium]|nr:RluA family pseudouridine synthase [Gammaproteobacteria bacterium]